MDPNGVVPNRLSQIKPKYDKYAQGCYAVCCPTIDDKPQPQWLKTFDYATKKMLSAKDVDKKDREANKKAQAMKGQWLKYKTENPYLERYGTSEEKEKDLHILENLSDWKEIWEVMQHEWYQACRKATRSASIKEFIEEGTRVYTGTKRENTFMFWHDRLYILWDKTTQEWLRRLKCPIDGWETRRWADRFLRILGKYNDRVTKYYQDSLPGDSPELMPLDNHLFFDVKEGTARNVAFSFFLPDSDADKYSLRTPRHVFDSIERTIRSGCPSTERLYKDIMRIPITLQCIIDSKGVYIADQSTTGKRKGVRGEAEEESRKRLKMIDPSVQDKFSTLLATMFEGDGVPFRMNDDTILLEIEDASDFIVDGGAIDHDGAIDYDGEVDADDLVEEGGMNEEQD